MANKRIAVIGVGVSGLSAIKSCLEEGLEPIAFEKEADVGGVWNYTPEEDRKRICVFESVHTNTNRVSYCYSDFPFPDEGGPMYASHQGIKAYLKKYAENFNLEKHIRFKSEVISIVPEDTREKRWKVQWRSEGSDVHTENFDGVMVCNGFYNKPSIPSFNGLDEFQGEVRHSGHYRSHDTFKGQRVLVAGFGNSGCDIACKLSDCASEVFLSTRHGAWVIPRVWSCNTTFETWFGNHFMDELGPLLPFYNKFLETYARSYIDNDAIGILPKTAFGTTIETLSDDIVQKIAYGKVKVRPGVVKVDKTGVLFKDGTYQNVDAIILATGFEAYFPFLCDDMMPWKGEEPSSLYKLSFPMDPKHEGLCFVGAFQSPAPLLPMYELQARMVARVLSGKLQLPDRSVMEKWLKETYASVDKDIFRDHFPILSWNFVRKEFATFLGVQPRPWKTLLSDFELGKAILFNTPSPSVYRLTGPHTWDGARRAVIDADKNLRETMSPMHTGDSFLNVICRRIVKLCGLLFFLGAMMLLFGIIIGRFCLP